MKKILGIILGLILLIVLGVFIGRTASIRNSFSLNIESDTDIQFENNGDYFKKVSDNYKKGIRRLASTTGSCNPTFYSYMNNGKLKEVTGDKYFIKKELHFRTTNDNFDVRCAISVDSTNSSELNNALRVLMVIDDHYYLFAPGENPELYYKGIASIEDGVAKYNDDLETISRLNKTVVLENNKMLDEFTLTIYVWYEINDTNISSYKATGRNETNLTITLY